MSTPFGIIGCGRMAQALVVPLIERELLLPENIFAVVGSEASVQKSLEKLPKGIKIVSRNDSSSKLVWDAPIQLLAVKPQQLNEVAKKANDALNQQSENQSLLISLLAGVNLKRLQEAFPYHKCVRAVPNTPALIAAGLTGISWGEGISSDQKNYVKDLFSPISDVFELEESQLDSFLALTSSGPAYVALIIEALSDGAVAAGLSRYLANSLAQKMLQGSALLLEKKELHPGELKDMVASPGGTTITALRHLEKAGVRSALIEAVIAAAERSREMI